MKIPTDVKPGIYLEFYLRQSLTTSELKFLYIADDHGIEPALAHLKQFTPRPLTSGMSSVCGLVYCSWEADSAHRTREIADLAGIAEVLIHENHGDPQQAYDFWPLFETPSAARVFCFGAQTLLDSIGDMSGHWPSTSIHLTLCAAATTAPLTPPPPVQSDTTFTVSLERSGEKIVVAADQSILQALRAHGHSVPSSCESGSCGTCRTGLISGEADHRDWVLFEDEQATHIMLCVSRAKSAELVLDL